MGMEKINLLIIDDEIAFLESMKKLLEVRDFHVIAVDRGEAALSAAEEFPVDIALLDLKMPGLGGEATLKALKRDHPWMEIVILTGHGSVESAVDLTKSGAYSYLQKPCELDRLLEVLTDAYKKKVMNKMQIDEQRMSRILQAAQGSSARAILRKIRELDRED